VKRDRLRGGPVEESVVGVDDSAGDLVGDESGPRRVFRGCP